jgi:hypothetical protein
MYDLVTRTRAIGLCRSGIPNADIAKSLSIPKGTIGYWKYLDRAKHPTLYPVLGPREAACPRCHGVSLDHAAYAYLLGLYLGDGYILDKYKYHYLQITCCDSWPGLMDDAESALRTVLPGASIARLQRTGCTNVTSYSKHWVCLFPQHGPGKKHERKIELADWQQEIVKEYPQDFIRGLIHSDGCRITNWTQRIVAGEMKRYEYPRYIFTNASVDIRDLYTWALDMVGVQWTRNSERNTSVAKKASVALIDTFVGPKY